MMAGTASYLLYSNW